MFRLKYKDGKPLHVIFVLTYVLPCCKFILLLWQCMGRCSLFFLKKVWATSQQIKKKIENKPYSVTFMVTACLVSTFWLDPGLCFSLLGGYVHETEPPFGALPYFMRSGGRVSQDMSRRERPVFLLYLPPDHIWLASQTRTPKWRSSYFILTGPSQLRIPVRDLFFSLMSLL